MTGIGEKHFESGKPHVSESRRGELGLAGCKRIHCDWHEESAKLELWSHNAVRPLLRTQLESTGQGGVADLNEQGVRKGRNRIPDPPFRAAAILIPAYLHCTSTSSAINLWHARSSLFASARSHFL